MYAPALRLERAELKCKSGCGYFGYPAWDGYCSKCHREQRQQTAPAVTPTEGGWQESESPVSASGPRKQESRDKSLTPTHAAQPTFSKFEQKRLRQTDSLKKTNLLKFNVFRKNTDENEKESASNTVERVPKAVMEEFVRDLTTQVPGLGAAAERHLKRFLEYFVREVIRFSNLSAEQLSECIQNRYQLLMQCMEREPQYSHIDPDTREIIIDIVEEHAMTFLHQRVLGWGGEREDRADRDMQARIRQLGWVRAAHLDCRVHHDTQKRCKLLYSATHELLSMDACQCPGGKLSSVRRCCASVVALVSDCVGAPASADDLLPALIYTVLKANPPRLISNINYVTRFSNASRLMTGERGYYFTNLCCAVSFIEKLSAESLGMSEDEFECYMNMPACIGGSSWTLALGVCERDRVAESQRETVQELTRRASELQTQATQLQTSSQSFHEEITKKTETLLEQAPLKVKRRVPPFGIRYLLPHPPPDASEPEFHNESPLIDISIDDTVHKDELVDKTKESINRSEESVDITEESINITEESINRTEESVNITEESINTAKESINTTKELINTTEELIDTTEELINTTEELMEKTDESVASREEMFIETDEHQVSSPYTSPEPDETSATEELDRLDEASSELARETQNTKHSNEGVKSFQNVKEPSEEIENALNEKTLLDSRNLGKVLEEDLLNEAGQQPPPLADVNYDLDLSDLSDAPNILDDSPQCVDPLPPPLTPSSVK